MVCPNCQSEIAEGKRFCGRCGVALIDERASSLTTASSPVWCSKCGKEVKWGKKFCGSCGAPLARQPSELESTRLASARTIAPLVQSQSAATPRISKSSDFPSAAAKAPASRVHKSATTSPIPSARVPRELQESVSARAVGSVIAVIVILVALGAWYAWGVELDVVSEPPGSQVTLDGRFLGSTDAHQGRLSLHHLTRGTHSLSLAYPGFDAWSNPVSLGWFELSHPLIVTLAVQSFPLSVTTNPGRSKVELDGQDAGVSDEGGTLIIERVPRGRHAVTVAFGGYPSRSSTVWIGGPSSIRIDLVAAAAAENAEIQLYLQRAQAFYQQRQFDAAIAECENALRLDPTNEQAAKLKAQIQQTKAILGVQ